jgi:N-acetyl-anhydromuramyl-L-alanine amidase AmpD
MKFIETIKTSKITKWRNTCEYILLHHTASWSSVPWTNVVKYLAQNSAQVSVHYVVDRNWDVYKLADDKAICRHAWVSSWEWKTDLNKYSIWIEIVSDGTAFTDEQRNSVRELIKYLINKHNLNISKVVRHKDIAPGRKVDVGDNFWNNQFKSYSDYQNSYIEKSESDLAKDLWIWNWLEWDRAATRSEVATMIYRLYTILNK